MPYELNTAVRTTRGSHAAANLRHKHQIPAVVYSEGKPGTSLTLQEADWKKLLASGQRVVTLKMAEGDKQVLIKDVQYDPLGEATIHVDFIQLREGQTVRVAVALVTKGVPKGHVEGGLLQQPIHTVHVECLPDKIPEKIIVDVEPMMVDDVIHIKDLKMPEGVKAVDAPDTVLIAVHVPKVEVAPVVAEAGPLEPEVLTAKKEEEPAEGAAEGKAEGKPEKKEEKKKEEKK